MRFFSDDGRLIACADMRLQFQWANDKSDISNHRRTSEIILETAKSTHKDITNTKGEALKAKANHFDNNSFIGTKLIAND